AELHAAIAFADGRCVPLHADRDAWVPERPIPLDDSAVVLAANAEGFALHELDRSSTSVALAIYPARAAAGQCSSPALARRGGTFQQLTARTGTRGAFRFPRVLGWDARVTCVDAGNVVDTLTYEAKTGTVIGTLVGSAYGPGECSPVVVVDPAGRPVEGARVFGWNHSGNFGTGTSEATDARGR